MHLFTILIGPALALATVGGPFDTRVVVASPTAQLALIELQTPDRLSYRACRTFPVYPSDLGSCAQVGADLPNRHAVRAALEQEFTAQLDVAMVRLAAANTPLGMGQRALVWGAIGVVAQAVAERVFRGPGVRPRELALGFLGWGGGSLIYDHYFAAQRRQDATLARRMGDMAASAQPNRLGGTDVIRARRDMGIVNAALRRAINRVSGEHAAPREI